MTKEKYEELKRIQRKIAQLSVDLGRLDVEGEMFRVVGLTKKLLGAAFMALDIPLLRAWREFQKKDEA